MVHLLRWLTLAALISSPALADKVTTFNLENGLQVVVIEDHRAPVVVQMVWYRAGSADEKPGVSGVAHFLEHLMFKGTDTVPSGAFSRTPASLAKSSPYCAIAPFSDCACATVNNALAYRLATIFPVN